MSAQRSLAIAMRRGVGASRMGNRAIRLRGGGGEKAPPPFRRLAMPTSTPYEQSELLWNDGVAPELCIDFDCAHMSRETGLMYWLGGFGFFAAIATCIYITDPASQKRTTTRELPYNNLALELGGSAEEAEDDE